jgi:hypothetical protein
MANVKIVFSGTEESETEQHELVLFANSKNNIYIGIDMFSCPGSWICFDKATAVSLVRELKKQIGFLESEVDNG